MNNNTRLDQTGAAFDYGIYVMTIYAVAATNLYGLISLEELAEVANAYRNSPSGGGSPQPTKYTMYTQNPDDIRMPRNIKPDDVMEYLNMNAKTQNYVALIDYRGTRYLASRDFVILEDGKETIDWEDVGYILHARARKPRYQPGLAEFVMYGGIGKFDPYTLCGPLFVWLTKRGIDKKASQKKLADKVLGIISDDDFEITEVIKAIDNVLIHKGMDRLNLTVAEMNELLAILSDIKNDTRRWENYGHTPNEIMGMG